MKIIILAGGLGTRISEETDDKPKPMVLIGDKPILWHLMNIFSVQGYNDFILALGYKSDVIKRWLIDLNQLDGDILVDTYSGASSKLNTKAPTSWKVSALETGLKTQTGGRIARCIRYLPGQIVLATYGDGFANVDIKKLLEFHISHGKKATVTAVRPPARFGHMEIEHNLVTHFGEKNQSDEGWINGGFFILEPEVELLVLNDSESFESGALPRLVSENQLMAYHHKDFWQPMDTLREKKELVKKLDLPIPPWLEGIV